MRRHRTVEEPDNITADVVAGVLANHGYTDMASFVRSLGGGVQRANLEAMQLRSELQAVRERLHVYEPPQAVEPVSYKPGPMSDG